METLPRRLSAGVEPQTAISRDNSIRAFERAHRVFPGGLTRATIQSNPFPTYMERGGGAYITDIDGNDYIDLANNFTTLIHGHAFPPVVDAITRQAALGACFGNPTLHELDLAELLIGRVPGMETIRFVNTGTEAVMHAIKAARAYTGRRKIAKIEGAYHGAYDWAEVSESSNPTNWGGARPRSVALCKGTPAAVLDDVVVLPFNDAATTRDILDACAGELAAILVDPMPSRAGLVPGTQMYFDVLQRAANRHGALIICDEVLNFRLSYRGAADRFGLLPDLITLGKIIGGGLPIGAIGGRANVMNMFAPGEGGTPTPQGGTFSANPLSMTAGLVSMTHLTESAFTNLETMGDRLRSEIRKMFAKSDADMSVTGLGSLFRIHPFQRQPTNYRQAYRSPDAQRRLQGFAGHLFQSGVVLAAGGLGALSTAMSDDEIDKIIEAFGEALRFVSKQ